MYRYPSDVYIYIYMYILCIYIYAYTICIYIYIGIYANILLDIHSWIDYEEVQSFHSVVACQDVVFLNLGSQKIQQGTREPYPTGLLQLTIGKWVCLKIVYPYTQWLMIIIPTKWL